MKKYLPISVAATLALVSGGAYAQGGGWGEGGKLEDTEIIVEKDRKIELPTAARNFQKAKLTPPEKKTSQVEYTFNDLKLPNQPVTTNMRVLTIKQEELPALYGNFVRAGIGNYLTPYLQAYFHNKRSDKFSVGASVRHLSSKNGPVEKEKSGVSNTGIDLTGEAYQDKYTFGTRLAYEHDRYNFYGYDKAFLKEVLEDSIKQVFNRISSKLYVHNQNGADKLKFNLGVGFNYFKDNYQAKETDFQVDLGTGYSLNSSSAIKLETNASFLKVDQNGSVNRNFVRIKPYYDGNFGKLNLILGANMAYSGDTLNDAKSFNIYPWVNVGYQVVENKLTVFGGITGDMERQTLFRLTRENPWLAPTVVPVLDSVGNTSDVYSLVQNTNKPLDVFGGLRGKAGPKLAFELKGGYRQYKNLYFYNNSATDSAKFTLLYDSAKTTAVYVSADVSYAASGKLRIGLKADYTNWKVEKLKQALNDTVMFTSDKPLHRPPLTANLYATYNVNDKILLTLDFYYIGATFARNFQREALTGVEKSLKTDNIIDLGLKADYRFSDRLSAFLSLYNIAGKKYERYLYYPQRGVQVLVGASYAF